MHNNLRRVYWKTIASAAVLVILAAAAGCQQAQPTLAPTIAVEPTGMTAPTEAFSSTDAVIIGEPTAYPAPGLEDAQVLPGDDYPPPASSDAQSFGDAYPAGPMAGQVIENRAAVTARLIEQAPDERPGFTKLRVEILESQDVAGMQNFTRDRLNQEIDVLAETEQMPNLQAGDNFTAEVAYEGDESGGVFFASQIEKTAP